MIINLLPVYDLYPEIISGYLQFWLDIYCYENLSKNRFTPVPGARITILAMSRKKSVDNLIDDYLYFNSSNEVSQVFVVDKKSFTKFDRKEYKKILEKKGYYFIFKVDYEYTSRNENLNTFSFPTTHILKYFDHWDKIYDEVHTTMYINDKIKPSSKFAKTLCSETQIGDRSYQEDRFINAIIPASATKGRGQIRLYGVFDGHSGDEASTFVQKNLVTYFFNTLLKRHLRDPKNKEEQESDDVKFALHLRKAVFALDKAILEAHIESGCTFCLCIIYEKTKSVYYVNLGDSGGFCFNPKTSTPSPLKMITPSGFTIKTDNILWHKPLNPGERLRYELNGLTLSLNGHYMMNGDRGLALTRALGDFHLKENALQSSSHTKVGRPSAGLSNLADVYVQHDVKDHFIILATDGVWDEYNDLYEKFKFPSGISSLISSSSYDGVCHKLAGFSNSHSDNQTVLLIKV